MIIGAVVAAAVHEDQLCAEDQDEADQVFQHPLLAYLNPGRFAEVRQTVALPLPKGFSR
jgi:hypothetical protein